jgi:hypothetical protein
MSTGQILVNRCWTRNYLMLDDAEWDRRTLGTYLGQSMMRHFPSRPERAMLAIITVIDIWIPCQHIVQTSIVPMDWQGSFEWSNIVLAVLEFNC